VMAMTSKGFWSWFARAGPSRSGCRIFWSKDVPSGVRPNSSAADHFVHAPWQRTAELDLGDERLGGLLRVDVVPLGLRVEESNLTDPSARFPLPCMPRSHIPSWSKREQAKAILPRILRGQRRFK
jgi:hypothetical protein